jgi:tRNA threonylcarbamoyladenosine biosynthesis protein TsaE
MESRSVFLADAAATAALGRQLAQRWLALPAAERPLLLLEGNLGAGKTCLVQGLAAGLGINEPVTSPTFALAQHYEGGSGALVHLDLYRLELPAAADELFAQEEEEALALGALLAVEWAGRLSFVPEGAWRLELMLSAPTDPEAGRVAQLDGIGPPPA